MSRCFLKRGNLSVFNGEKSPCFEKSCCLWFRSGCQWVLSLLVAVDLVDFQSKVKPVSILYLLQLEKSRFKTIRKKRFTKCEIWWFKPARLDKQPCGFYWRLSDDGWTLLPFSAKLLLSADVSESRGDAPSLAPVSGTIFREPLGGNSVTRSGRVNQSGRLNSISEMI